MYAMLYASCAAESAVPLAHVAFPALVLWALVLVFITFAWEIWAPSAYGRFSPPLSSSSFFFVNARFGWWLLEAPCSLIFVPLTLTFRSSGSRSWHSTLPSTLLTVLFIVHYIYRGWLFPFLMRTHDHSRFSVIVALGGWFVTVPHALLSFYWLNGVGSSCGALGDGWSPNFVIGVVLYISGLCLIIWHDHLLRVLRSNQSMKDEPRYKIPQGGLFSYVSAPHYLSELIAWLGFAIANAGPNGFFIFAVSCANLLPRSVATHSWYHKKFRESYPPDRKKLVPFLW